MKLVLASNNANKLREIKKMLEPLGYEVLSQRDAGVDIEPDENGTTFRQNAQIKAQAIYDICKMPVISDDSGLCVDFLNGAPGIHSARYAPEDQLCDKLLREMQTAENRNAHFCCAICYIDENGVCRFFEGKCEGKIGHEKLGSNGFGYDPVFVYSNGLTLAQMESEEKNRISHRANALNKFVEYLRGQANV